MINVATKAAGKVFQKLGSRVEKMKSWNEKAIENLRAELSERTE